MIARAADVMITRPKTLPADATVAQVRRQLADDHVHLALLVGDGVLLGVISGDDLPDDARPDAPVASYARYDGRTVPPDASLASVCRRLRDSRRLAVVADDGRLLGLVCRNRHGDFCTDAGVAARAAERQLPG